MGRVSRYKKIKPCDPFYRGPRRDLSRGDNLRPDDEEQPVPKSLIRLMKRAEQMKSRAKRKKKRSSSGSMQSEDTTGKRASSEKKTVGGRRKETDREKEEEKEEEMFHRRAGENLKDYFERIDIESNAKIMESYRTSRKMTEKRKRYLEKRRRRLKGEEFGEDDKFEAEDEKQPKDFTDLRDEVRFGEVVSAPPKLSAKPRGSVRKKKEDRSSGLLLKQKLNPGETVVRQSGERVKPPKAAVGLKRQKDLEVERERAILLYRETKRTKLAQTGSRQHAL